MKLEDQVCSLELAKRLKELLVKQASAFYWLNVHWEEGREPRWCLLKSEELNGERWRELKVGFSAFTVAELFDLLPCQVTVNKYLSKGVSIRFDCVEHISIENYAIHDDRLPDCMTKMLIHLIGGGFVKL